MIEHYTIKLASDDLAKLSKVKAKLEIIAHYAEMGKVRDLLKELLNRYLQEWRRVALISFQHPRVLRTLDRSMV
jgi:hypothetical protein